MGARKRLGQIVPPPRCPGHVQLRGWVGRQGPRRSLWMELPDGWVTPKGYGGEKQKRTELLEGEQYSYSNSPAMPILFYRSWED